MKNSYLIDNDFWLRLDNAAKIYPAIRSKELTSVFRISAELHERIKIRQLFESIRIIETRFPYYQMKLRSGFFWYYLEYENLPIQVRVDNTTPCRDFRNNEMMYRILVKETRISVEFSHILTDATGAFEFLKTLLFCYFETCGHILPNDIPYCKPHEKALEEEYEDAFSRYFKKNSTPVIGIPKAFQLPFQLRSKPRFNVLLGIIPLNEIINKSKTYEVSLTEYLTAVYLHVLQEVYLELPERIQNKSPKKARIEVPVNLRKIFPSRTMRNFSLYVMPEIDFRLGRYTFDELIKIVYHQMKLETDKKLINKMISRNVGSERNLLIRSIPLFLKSFILSKVYMREAGKYSGVITNLGKIDFSPDLNRLIKRFVFIPPPANKHLKINCGVAGFNNMLVLSFGNISCSKKLERFFFTFLIKQGIPVKIEYF